MMIAIGDSMSELASSITEEDGEDEQDEHSELGQRSEDDKPGRALDTDSKMVQQCMERLRPQQMKLDKVTQPGWADATNCFRERDKNECMTQQKVPAVIEP